MRRGLRCANHACKIENVVGVVIVLFHIPRAVDADQIQRDPTILHVADVEATLSTKPVPNRLVVAAGCTTGCLHVGLARLANKSKIAVIGQRNLIFRLGFRFIIPTFTNPQGRISKSCGCGLIVTIDNLIVFSTRIKLPIFTHHIRRINVAFGQNEFAIIRARLSSRETSKRGAQRRGYCHRDTDPRTTRSRHRKTSPLSAHVGTREI